VNVNEILSLLPEGLLEDLALETQVNKYSKKLQGEVMFKLLLLCILSHKENSLRTMSSAYESMVFQLLNADRNKGKVRYNSISERLSTIDASYFEKIYEACVSIYTPLFELTKKQPVRFDSTIVTLSSKLLEVGYLLKGGDAENIRQLKFTIGLSHLPVSVHFFHEQKYTSENIALKESILDYKPDQQDVIRIFDKGLNSRKTYDELIEKGIPFISKVNTNSKHDLVYANTLTAIVDTPTLNIYSDTWVYLYTERGRAKHPVRCIRAKIKASGEEIVFVSNIKDISCVEITELYKMRWDIEVFFKFLKQDLNFSHLINRSENGIRIMLYMTMIASILLLVYKAQNNLKGYKIMKQQFVQDIEKFITIDIVIMCGGDPSKAGKILNINTS
jgi:transposase